MIGCAFRRVELTVVFYLLLGFSLLLSITVPSLLFSTPTVCAVTLVEVFIAANITSMFPESSAVSMRAQR